MFTVGLYLASSAIRIIDNKKQLEPNIRFGRSEMKD
jgi:hypothetical protein